MTARVSGAAPRCRRPRAKRLVSLGILHGDRLESASLCPTILPAMDNLGRW